MDRKSMKKMPVWTMSEENKTRNNWTSAILSEQKIPTKLQRQKMEIKQKREKIETWNKGLSYVFSSLLLIPVVVVVVADEEEEDK